MTNPNPNTDANAEEIHDLACRVCDGGITASDRDRLENLIREDRGLLRLYIDYLQVNAGLVWRYRTGSGTTDGEQASEAHAPGSSWKTFGGNSSASATRRYAAWAILLATTAAALVLAVTPRKPTPEVDESAQQLVGSGTQFVATLKDSTAAVWRDDANPLDVGGRVAAGSLRMGSGRADLILDSGVRLLVEGPADLSLRSEDEAFLESGKIAVFVPEHAIGFRLLTRTSTLIDQGTEFGVVAEDSGATEVHVFKGRVDLLYNESADGRDLQPQRVSLLDRQARRVSLPGTQGEGVAFAPDTFSGLADQIAEPIVWPVSEGGNGHFYQLVVHASPVSWQHAAIDAFNRHHQGYAGHLATVTSEEEHRFLVDAVFKDRPLSSVWIGMTDVLREGHFRWITGESLDYECWADRQPDNFFEWDGHGGEDYGMYSNLAGQPWSWNDLSNDSMHESVRVSLVEYEPSTPANRDRSIQTEPIGWTEELGGEGQHYRLVLALQPLSWDDASERAEKSSLHGVAGHLATFESPVEQEFVVDEILKVCGVAENYIGLFSNKGAGELQWLSGKPLNMEPYVSPKNPAQSLYGQMRWLDKGWRLQTVASARRPTGWLGYLVEYPPEAQQHSTQHQKPNGLTPKQRTVQREFLDNHLDRGISDAALITPPRRD